MAAIYTLLLLVNVLKRVARNEKDRNAFSNLSNLHSFTLQKHPPFLKIVTWVLFNTSFNLVLCFFSLSYFCLPTTSCFSSLLAEEKPSLIKGAQDRFQLKNSCSYQKTICLFCIAMTISDKRSKNMRRQRSGQTMTEQSVQDTVNECVQRRKHRQIKQGNYLFLFLLNTHSGNKGVGQGSTVHYFVCGIKAFTWICSPI